MNETISPVEDSETVKSWRPLLWVAFFSFCILSSYGIARSAIDSLLLQDQGGESLKYAYGAVAISVTIVVTFYAKASAKFSIGSMIVICTVGSALLLGALLSLRGVGFSWAVFGLYVWKDVYIVLLIELIWTLANSAFKQTTAKWAYGFLCVAGTLGDISGNFLLNKSVQTFGTLNVLWVVLPILIISAFVGLFAAKACGNPAPNPKERMNGLLSVVRSSRPIQLLLLLIATIQVSTTLIDYGYRIAALEAYPNLNDRTEIFSQVDMAISAISMGLQLCSGIIVTILGVKVLIVILPILIGVVACYNVFYASFASIAVLKIANKSIDYSLFRTSKELLYHPLSYSEKTQGKAAVDIFGYRVAKGGATGLLTLLSGAIPLLFLSVTVGVGIWFILAIFLALRFSEPS